MLHYILICTVFCCLMHVLCVQRLYKLSCIGVFKVHCSQSFSKQNCLVIFVNIFCILDCLHTCMYTIHHLFPLIMHNNQNFKMTNEYLVIYPLTFTTNYLPRYNYLLKGQSVGIKAMRLCIVSHSVKSLLHVAII